MPVIAPLSRGGALILICATLAGCGMFGGGSGNVRDQSEQRERGLAQHRAAIEAEDNGQTRSTIWDLFTNNADPNTTVEVNRYIWNAALEVLDFLPIESVDPFSGVIVTGYGTPPGGGRAYRATVYVQDPALDARSLVVAMQTRGGGSVDRDTSLAIEDAILTRARQLRIRDSRL